MALTKIINDENKSYKPVLTDKLVLDNKPTVNSFNAVTSDAVARAVAGASGEVPAVTSSDDGKVLTAIYDEGGAAVEWADAQAGLPDMTGQDGKVLGAVDVEGTVEAQWINPPTELPASLGSAGQVLTVNAGGTGVEWASPQGASYTALNPISIGSGNQIQLNYTPDLKLSTLSYPSANLTMLDSNKAIQVVQQFDTGRNQFYELHEMPAYAQGYPFFGLNGGTGGWFRIAWAAGSYGANKISLSNDSPVGILIYKKDDPTSYYTFVNDEVQVGSYGSTYTLGVLKNSDGTLHSNLDYAARNCYWEVSAHLINVYDQGGHYENYSNFFGSVLNNSTNADKYAVCFYIKNTTGGTAPNGCTQITLGSQSFATTMIQSNYLQIANPVPAYNTTTDLGKVLTVTANGLAWISLT